MLIIKTTTDSLPNAKNIANILIKERLAACVQIKEIVSVYKWNENISESQEFEISIKTTNKMYETIENKIKSIHNYDLPQIFAIEVSHIEKKYEDWVKNINNER